MTTQSGPQRGAWSRRPSFTPRQVLTAELLNAGLSDELMRQQLLNRAVHGYGVVLGLGLSVGDDGKLDLHRGCLELSAGLALDRHGRMLLWQGGRISIADLVGPPPDRTGPYTLCAHYATRPPLDEDCPPYAGDRSHWSEEGIVFSLRAGCRQDERGCPTHPEGTCVSHEDYLSRRAGGLPGDIDSVPPSPDVDWLLRPPGPLRPTGDGRWKYDPDPGVCVPLACVRICDLTDPGKDAAGDDTGTSEPHTHDTDVGDGAAEGPAQKDQDRRSQERRHCDPRYGFCPDEEPETSLIRPRVHRNPLLYELVRCCDVDLPRVESVSWQEWTDRGWSTEVPWQDFEQRVTSTEHGFEVWFTKAMDRETLHKASIFMTASYQDRDAKWRSYGLPVRKLELLEPEGELRGARLHFDEEWVESEVTGRRSHLFGGAQIEVTIRGQLLRDECHQMLDARPVDVECSARCQARPGADLVSVFRVGPHPRGRSATYQSRTDESGHGPKETDPNSGSAE